MLDFIKSSFSFFCILLAILTVRWIGFEPFVIPSGSMIPSLLVHDHILVKKFSFGVRWPFTQNWITEIKLPKRGEIVVFKKPGEEPSYFMIKRVIGLPGDEIVVSDDGAMAINGKAVGRTSFDYKQLASNTKNPFYPVDEVDLEAHPESLSFFKQNLGPNSFLTQFKRGMEPGGFEAIIPEGHIFLMGDNRDNSMDSRFWGPLPVELLVGKASHVWLSCQETFSMVDRLCRPDSLRWDRFFHKIQ